MVADRDILRMLSEAHPNQTANTSLDQPDSKEEDMPVDKQTKETEELTPETEGSSQEAPNTPSVNLSSIFTEEAITSLSELPKGKLLSMNLKEVLAEVTKESISGPWVKTSKSGKEILTGTYKLNTFYKLVDLLRDILSQAGYIGCEPSTSTYKEGSDWVLEVVLEGIPLSSKDLQLAQYSNYRHTNIEAGEMDRYCYSEEVTTDSKEIPYQLSNRINAIPIQALNENGTKTLRVPMAVIGEWEHPQYGKLSFTQQDFDEMKTNFSSNVLGYEPPLFLGHPNNSNGTTEGHPAEGFLASMPQIGDVLYGDYEVVNSQTYKDVDEGKFRYASGEFLRQYKTKKDGSNVGTTLVGCALTNRPFLPGLPRVRTLSESNHISTILLTDPLTMTDQTNVADTQAKESEYNSFKEQILSEFNTLKQNYTDNVDSLKQELSEKTALAETTAQQLSDVTAERDSLAEKVSKVEEEKKQAALEVKLAELNSFVIPQEEKQKFTELLKAGTLGESEEAVMSSLRTLSEQMTTTATVQHGTETATEALNDPSVTDPYAQTIQRNEAAAKARAEKLAERLI